MKVSILETALEDLRAACKFYDEQEEGVGAYFLDSLIPEIDSLSLYAGIHRLQFGFHRLLARRFPYAIYYRVVAEGVVVFRVLNCRRDPSSLRRSIRKSA